MIVSEPPAFPPIRLQHKLWLDNLVDLFTKLKIIKKFLNTSMKTKLGKRNRAGYRRHCFFNIVLKNCWLVFFFKNKDYIQNAWLKDIPFILLYVFIVNLKQSCNDWLIDWLLSNVKWAVCQCNKSCRWKDITWMFLKVSV